MLSLWLLVLLITALMTGPALVVETLLVEGPWSLLLPLLAFVAMEGMLTTQWLTRPQQRQLDRFQYRIAEGVFLALVVRLLTWAITDTPLTADTLYLYWQTPFAFLDLPFVVYLLLTFIAWQETIYLTNLFLRLPLDAGELYSVTKRPQTSELDDDRRLRQSDRIGLAHQFLTHLVNGGIVLVLCTAVTTIDMSGMAGEFDFRFLGRLGIPPLLLGALFVYLLLGLWLYSQTRWQTLQVRWQLERTTIAPALGQQWNRAALWLILGIAAAAAFLPIGSTFALSRILHFLILVIVGIVELILFVLVFLLNLPLALLAQNSNGVEPERIEPPDLTPPEMLIPPEVSSGPNLLANGLFWLALVVMTLLAVAFFLRERNFFLEKSRLNQWWQMIWLVLRNWWYGIRGRVAHLSHALQQRPRGDEETAAASPWHFFRLGTLSPREQIRYFYLAAVRRAGEKGVEREQTETPLEFAQDLKSSWPEADDAIDELTTAFLHARYSPQPIQKEDVNPVKRTWQQLKSSLRRTN